VAKNLFHPGYVAAGLAGGRLPRVSTMSDWIAAVCAELELDLADQEAATTAVLDLTADVAHGVARPAAPVTAYLVGLAAGRAADPDASTAELAAKLRAKAKAWEARA
jgi:hypothetical protein